MNDSLQSKGNRGYLGLYFIIAALAARIWLTDTTLASTLAGGLFGGLLMASSAKVFTQNRWLVEGYSAIKYMAGLGSYVWKQSLAPQSWEPSHLQSVCGPAAFLASFLGATWLMMSVFGVSDDYGPGPGKSKSVADGIQDAQPGPVGEAVNPIEPWPTSRLAAAAAALMVTTGVLVASYSPSTWGPVQFAVGRYIIDGVYEGDNVVASIAVDVPIVPFDVPDGKWNSREYKMKYMDLPRDQRRVASVVADVVFESTGTGGWQARLPSPLEANIHNAQVRGLGAPTKEQEPFASVLNLFGMFDLMTQRFNVFALLPIIVGAAAAVVAGPRKGLIAMLLGCALSMCLVVVPLLMCFWL